MLSFVKYFSYLKGAEVAKYCFSFLQSSSWTIFFYPPMYHNLAKVL